MALLTLNGYDVIRGTIRTPRIGVWNADLVVDTEDSITGPVTLATADGALSLSGTAFREGVFQQTLSMRVVGGAAGLSEPPGGIGVQLEPKSYQGVALGLVLGDILRSCGETLDPSSDQGTLNAFLSRWVVMAGPAKEALARLLDPFDVSWRTRPSGSLWVGPETWPPAAPVAFDVLERHYGEGRVVIGSEAPWLLPGVTIDVSVDGSQAPQRVSATVHEIGSARIRTEVWLEPST